MIREYVMTALQTFSSNKLRAALSLIGVVIGVASVVAVANIAMSGAAMVRKQFEVFGLDSVSVRPASYNESSQKLAFTDILATEIMNEIPEAKAVLKKSHLNTGGLSRNKKHSSSTLVAVDTRFFQSMGADIDIGRDFTDMDDYLGSPVVVIGSKLASDLFPEGEPLSKTIQASVGNAIVSLTVVGVLKQKQGMYSDDWDTTAYISFGTAIRRFDGNLKAQTFIVVAQSRDKVIKLGDKVTQFFLERSGDPEAFWIASPQQWAKENDKMINSLGLLLGGVAGISLVVGCIGIMNIMLASVSERTREIGVRKAIGATKGDITAQFIVETSALTLIGGIIGLGFGTLTAWLAVLAFHWKFVTSPMSAALACALSILVGLLAGVYPAKRAAKLDPIIALATE